MKFYKIWVDPPAADHAREFYKITQKPGSTSIFLLFGIILYFGLILVYTFNAIVISGLIYLIMVPISSMHYLMIKKNEKAIRDDTDHHEDVL